MSKKSDNTERIYNYLSEEWSNHQTTPSYREIADACNVSVSTVIYHLEKLEGQGRIERETYKSRSIRLIQQNQRIDDDEEQEQVYAFIKAQIDRGIVPTQKEIAEGCYLSRTKVRRCLASLEGQGRITVGKQARSIRLMENHEFS